MNLYAFDAEVFQNYTLFLFKREGVWSRFDHTQFRQLREFISKDMILGGYNNFGYDDIILRCVLDGTCDTPMDVYNLSKRIIGSEGRMPEDLFKIQYSRTPWHHSIDMYQVLNKKGGLKELECKYAMPSVVEGNVDFDLPLPESEWKRIEDYCRNDVMATWDLLTRHKNLIDLRTTLKDLYELGNRIYCLGDAGIAQAIFIDLYSKRTGGYSATARKAADQHEDNRSRCWKTTEIASRRIRFETPAFTSFYKMFRDCSLMGDARGTTWSYSHPSIQNIFKKPIDLEGCSYQIGVGGLHSIDKPGRFEATREVGIYDLDVASYYPSLIINEGIYPPQIGKEFLSDYIAIRDLRLAAKKRGDKIVSEALKILVNSTFGKFNDPYSPIRTIKGALQVTINGQLQLLMLAEMCEFAGFRILSANTDGLTLKLLREDKPRLEQVMALWQERTGHILELAEYKTYVRRDINNYLALKANDEIKPKGAYHKTPDIGKWDEGIVKRAAQSFLLRGIPIRESVEQSGDIKDFIYYQRVKNGGSVYSGETFVGKTARWYVGRGPHARQISRKNPDGSIERLPNGENGVLALTLPSKFPSDVDVDYYVHQACELVEMITNPDPPKKPRKKKTNEL